MAIHNLKIFQDNPKLLKGNVQIIACAGSGKTEFVSERIAFQIKEGIAKSSEIVALTFNDAAAAELKFRVRDKIKEMMGKQPDIGDMYIGTIHAFAFMILKEFVPAYRAYDMLDENSRKAFAVSLKWADGINIPVLYRGLQKRGHDYNRYYARNNPRYWENWTLSAFLNDVDFYREESLDESYTDSTSFKIGIRRYQEKLTERRFLDFSGILRLAVDHLEQDEYALNELRSRYKHFTIDEYQDVNPIQEQLIRLVSGKQNLCVVGDDDQSIYQWRGADVSNILDFNKNYEKVETHKLETNRRSHNNIVSCASEFIAKNNSRFIKAIQPNTSTTEEGDLYKLCFNQQMEEVDWIINKIKHLYGKEYVDKGSTRKLMYSDIVLLFRRRNDAHTYKDALEAEGINVVYSGMGGLMEAVEIGAIMYLLQYLGEVASNDNTEIDVDDLYDLINNSFSIKKIEFKKLINTLSEWIASQRRLSFQILYYKILAGLGIAGSSYHDDADDEIMLYNLGKFSQVISDFESSRTYLSKNDILRFHEYVQTFVAGSYDEGATNTQEGVIDAVKIMTLHGTKGLGFPVVFMPCLKRPRANNGERVTFLDTTKIDFSRYGGSLEDERRLYYVAITRAKKFLFVTTHHIKLGNKRRSALHEFWDEINDKHFITTDTPDPTVRNSCDIIRFDSDMRLPTSYSELSYYLSCSYDYKMRFVYGFNPELVQALGYGNQVHNLINLLHKDYERTGKIPDNNRLDELLAKHFYMRYAATKQEEILRESCKKSLANYLALWEKDFSLAIKTEQNFELDFEDKALISGSIDLLSHLEGQTDSLEIIDFKTGKQQSQFEEKYAHQVVLYTIAAKDALEKDIHKAYLHYLDAKEAKRIEVDITENRIAETRAKLSSAIDGITSNKFERKPVHGKCSNCDWHTICPKAK